MNEMRKPLAVSNRPPLSSFGSVAHLFSGTAQQLSALLHPGAGSPSMAHAAVDTGVDGHCCFPGKPIQYTVNVGYELNSQIAEVRCCCWVCVTAGLARILHTGEPRRVCSLCSMDRRKHQVKLCSSVIQMCGLCTEKASRMPSALQWRSLDCAVSCCLTSSCHQESKPNAGQSRLRLKIG